MRNGFQVGSSWRQPRPISFTKSCFPLFKPDINFTPVFSGNRIKLFTPPFSLGAEVCLAALNISRSKL